ncbi:TetR/AcrR family transcriptional regulator [Celeribacter ethanolicus]|uniref:TetR/AcrR family transcriptional regulator n=1 Tax=Celeribacter ethanolicus TaxID=1758178 RepID=UPI00083663F5|nr:TetR/AcrR family transcriptional regulator [Celeribacter ethanolicus]
MARTVLERSDLIPVLAEIFRRHGFEGASIGIIAKETGAGRSSLYHFFPGGKDEMADAVLADIALWFETHIFTPLTQKPAAIALPDMIDALDIYFKSGQRICLVGAFALDDLRDRFARRIGPYFTRWRESLQFCLERDGRPSVDARAQAIQILAAVQGGIVLARATGDDTAFLTAVTASVSHLGLPVEPEPRI